MFWHICPTFGQCAWPDGVFWNMWPTFGRRGLAGWLMPLHVLADHALPWSLNRLGRFAWLPFARVISGGGGQFRWFGSFSVWVAVGLSIYPVVGLPWPVNEAHGQRSSFYVIGKYTRQLQCNTNIITCR